MQNSLVKHTIFLTLFVGLLDFSAYKLYLYWTIWWYDMLVHFSAGVLVAFVLAVFWHYFSNIDYSRKKAIFIALFVSMCVGLLWEWFELYSGAASISDGFLYYRDMLSDLLLDCLGTFSGIFYINKFLRKDLI
jgi:hypothetical protein